MSIVSRYLAREIYLASGLVLLCLSLLFAFFDLIAELKDLGTGSYNLSAILHYLALKQPTTLYELLPVAVLVGSLFALARLSQHSEFTVMRVSGLSPQRLVRMVFWLGLPLVVVALLLGEFIAPATDRQASQLKNAAKHALVAREFRSGLWIKDGQSFINIGEIMPDVSLHKVSIYTFDASMALTTVSQAREARYISGSRWRLEEVRQTLIRPEAIAVTALPQMEWNSSLAPSMLTSLLLQPQQMSARDLYRYVQHLEKNRQKSGRYAIALWSRLFYPVAIWVMLLLALPFAYHQTRSGDIGTRVFIGILLGLAFNLINRVFANVGLLADWPALLSALLPSLLFLLLAVLMLFRVERR